MGIVIDMMRQIKDTKTQSGGVSTDNPVPQVEGAIGGRRDLAEITPSRGLDPNAVLSQVERTLRGSHVSGLSQKLNPKAVNAFLA